MWCYAVFNDDLVSDIAIFVLKRDVKLQLTLTMTFYKFTSKSRGAFSTHIGQSFSFCATLYLQFGPVIKSVSHINRVTVH